MQGTIQKLMRFPVKSLMGESLQDVPVGEAGLEHDRRFAFVKPENTGRFPWFTTRDFKEMQQYRPVWTAEGLRVESPDGERFEVTDKSLVAHFEAKYARSIQLKHNLQGCPDAFPISIINLAQVRRLEKILGFNIDPVRFRGNVLVEFSDEVEDDHLLGAKLKFSSGVEVKLLKKDTRCKVINIDPKSNDVDTRVLMAVGKNFGGCFGLYGNVTQPGRLRVGEMVNVSI